MPILTSWWQRYLRSRYEKIEFYDISPPDPGESFKFDYYTITTENTPMLFSRKRSANVNFFWTDGMWEIFVDCLRETSMRGYVLVVNVIPYKGDPNIIGNDWIEDEVFDEYFRYFDISDEGLMWLKNFMDNINFSAEYICCGGIIEEFPFNAYHEGKKIDKKGQWEYSLGTFIGRHHECKGVEFREHNIMCRPFPGIQEVLFDKLKNIRLKMLGLIDP